MSEKEPFLRQEDEYVLDPERPRTFSVLKLDRALRTRAIGAVNTLKEAGLSTSIWVRKSSLDGLSPDQIVEELEGISREVVYFLNDSRARIDARHSSVNNPPEIV